MSLETDSWSDERFLSEALPLIATYFSGEGVELSGASTRASDEADDEALRFSNQLRFRHALACCADVVPLIRRIESGVSTVTTTVRTETKGVIRGRLDIPRYVARKAIAISWPRTYPVLVTEEDPSTPENVLARRVLHSLFSRLNPSVAPTKSAEAAQAQWYRRWLSNRLAREPWCQVGGRGNPHRLRMETARRIARRQTGNERTYADLIRVVDEWRLFGGEIGGGGDWSKLSRALLAFPSDEAFKDRIFEIWCLRELAGSVLRQGAQLIDGPNPLTLNKARPIYTFSLGGKRIELWFQRALDKQHARWTYSESGQGLRGIPDITVIAEGIHYLVVDAKNRSVQGNTRPEETYKMLGYFENFRPLLGGTTNWAILCFVSLNGFVQQLSSVDSRRVLLTSAHPQVGAQCSFSAQIDSGMAEWIGCWRNWQLE